MPPSSLPRPPGIKIRHAAGGQDKVCSVSSPSMLNSMCVLMIAAYAFLFLFISLCVNLADCSLDSPLQVNVRASPSHDSSGLRSSVWPLAHVPLYWSTHELIAYAMTVHASRKCREKNCSFIHVLCSMVAAKQQRFPQLQSQPDFTRS